MNRKLVLVALLAFLAPTFVSAQAEVKTLTMEQAIKTALKNNLELKQLKQDVKTAESKIKQAWADLYLPDMSAGLSFTYLDPGTVDSAIIGPVTNAWADNYSGNIQVAKPLYMGSILRNSYELKKIDLDLTKKKVLDKKRDIALQVRMDFYNLFLLKENIVVMEELDKQLAKSVAFTKALYNAGQAPKYDLIKIQVQHMNNRPKILQLKNAYKTSQMAFLDLIGLESMTANIEYVGSLRDGTNLTSPTMPQAEAIKIANKNNLSLLTIQFTRKTFELTKKIADAAKLPTVSSFIQAGLDYKKNRSGTDPARAFYGNLTAGVTVSIPIDDWLPASKRAESVREIDLAVEKLKLTEKQLEQGIRLRVKSLYLEIEVAVDTLKGQDASVSQAKLGRDLANQKYRAGTISSLELNDAEMAYQQAQQSYLSSLYKLMTSVLKLDRMMKIDPVVLADNETENKNTKAK